MTTYSFINKQTGAIRTYGANSFDYAFNRLVEEVGSNENWAENWIHIN